MQIDRYVAERRRKQWKRRIYFWSTVGVLALYFMVLGFFIFFVEAPPFQAKQIAIVDASSVPTSSVMDLLEGSLVNRSATFDGLHDRWRALLGFHNMLIWPKALSSSSIAVIPQLAGITMAKNYFLHTITVTVTERQPLGVWCEVPDDGTASALPMLPPEPATTSTGAAASGTGAAVSGTKLNNPTPNHAGESCVWFDNHGVAFAHAVDTEGGAIIAVHDYTNHKIVLNAPVLDQAFLPNLISIVNVLKASGLSVGEIALRNLALQQVDVTTLNGPTLYFSLRFPADNDLAVIKNLLTKPGFGKLQYINFTVSNRAYYE